MTTEDYYYYCRAWGPATAHKKSVQVKQWCVCVCDIKTTIN